MLTSKAKLFVDWNKFRLSKLYFCNDESDNKPGSPSYPCPEGQKSAGDSEQSKNSSDHSHPSIPAIYDVRINLYFVYFYF